MTPGPLFGLEQANSTRQILKQTSLQADDTFQRSLVESTSATVVTVHYRLGPMAQGVEGGESTEKEIRFFQFPTPIHDTLAAFDWVNENLHPRTLGTVGARIGGALAVMLALTEPRKVTATATISPITNWADLDNWCINKHTENEKSFDEGQLENAISPSELVPLLSTRERLFQIPCHYFSPFASPLLFLRSAGVVAPRSMPRYYTGPAFPIPKYRPPPKEELEAMTEGELDDLLYQKIDLSADSQRVVLSQPFYKVVGRYTRWTGLGPPVDEKDLSRAVQGPRSILPYTRIYSHQTKTAPLLASQGKLLARAMELSCFGRHEKGTASERVQVEYLPEGHDIWKFDDQTLARSISQFFIDVIEQRSQLD